MDMITEKQFNYIKSKLGHEIKDIKQLKKSTKLAKLERNRYSIFTDDYIHCYYCHNFKSKLDIHEVYGGSNRQRSMKYGLCVPLCRTCHSNEMIIQDLRKWCQRKYEENHTRAEFLEIIGKSYL